MKKLFSCFIILICFLLLGNTQYVYAAEIDTDDISNSTYVIGKCMFTRDVSDKYSGSLSTDVIMLASKTIDSNNLEDMIIYYKNARGIWVNALTNETTEIDEKVDIEYKNNEIYLETPTLTSNSGSADTSVYARFEINMEGYYAIEGNMSTISGWELYEKVGDDYNLVEGHEVEVDAGERKIYVARAYALNKDNEKVYSEYSNEYVIDNSKVETPTLSSGYGSSDTVMFAEFAIDLEGYYSTDGALDRITGWELYEKVGDDYNLVEGHDVEVDAGERKIYVARAYALNKDNEKVYSEYSDEYVIDNSKVETPTLSSGYGSSDTVMFAEFAIDLEGYYSTDGALDRITGWELYEKVGDDYNLVEGHEVEVDAGERKIYVARAYALNKDNEKVYSEYSNEYVIDNSKVETPTLSSGYGSSDTVMFAEFAIDLEGYYSTDGALDRITGWELYEKVEDDYNLVEGHEVEVDAGERKIYVARAYALNKDNEKVYSEYSNEYVIDNSN